MDVQYIRENTIKKFIAADLLNNNIVPTNAAVCAVANAQYADAEVFKSMVKTKDIDALKHASISGYNTFKNKIYIDLKSVDSYINELFNRLSDTYSYIYDNMNIYTSQLIDIENRCKALLLASDAADGYTQVFVEDFTTLNNIDLDKTTTVINTEVSVAKSDIVNTSVNELINLTSVAVDTTCMNTSYISFNKNLNKLSAFISAADRSYWPQTVVMPGSYNGNIEIIIRVTLPNLKEINNISFSIIGVAGIAVSAMDGTEIVELTEYKEYNSLVNVVFDKIETKTIFIRIQSDNRALINGKYEYSIFISGLNIKLIGESEDSVLESKPIQFTKQFNYLSLETKESTDSSSSIDYSISFKQNNQWTNYESIVPLNKASVYGENDKILYTSEELIEAQSDIPVSYSYNSTYSSYNNVTIDKSYNSYPSFNVIKTKIIRNIDTYSANDQHYFHKDAESGHYTGYFYISSNSTDLNLTNYPCSIDDAFINTKLTLSKGIHKIRFSAQSDPFLYKGLFRSMNIVYGTYVSGYVNPDKFIALTEDDDYTKFSIVPATKDDVMFYVPIVKTIDANEKLFLLRYYFDENSGCTEIKYRAILNSSDAYSPEIYKIKIRTN